MENCNLSDCASHAYVYEALQEVRAMTKVVDNSQHEIKETIVKLTENLLEMQRMNDRFDRRAERQDTKIDENSNFVNKALGIIGALSFTAMLSPVVFWVIDKMSG